MDELSSVLDTLEAKNDDLHQKLKDLLESSKEERLELKSKIAGKTDDGKHNDDEEQRGNSSTSFTTHTEDSILNHQNIDRGIDNTTT